MMYSNRIYLTLGSLGDSSRLLLYSSFTIISLWLIAELGRNKRRTYKRKTKLSSSKRAVFTYMYEYIVIIDNCDLNDITARVRCIRVYGPALIIRSVVFNWTYKREKKNPNCFQTIYQLSTSSKGCRG